MQKYLFYIFVVLFVYSESLKCSSFNVCGLTWKDASNKCNNCCISKDDCPSNEECWANIYNCFNTNNILTDVTEIQQHISPTMLPSFQPNIIKNSFIHHDNTLFDITHDSNGINKFNPIILLWLFGGILVLSGLIFVIYLIKTGVKQKHTGIKKYNIVNNKSKHDIKKSKSKMNSESPSIKCIDNQIQSNNLII